MYMYMYVHACIHVSPRLLLAHNKKHKAVCTYSHHMSGGENKKLPKYRVYTNETFLVHVHVHVDRASVHAWNY